METYSKDEIIATSPVTSDNIGAEKTSFVDAKSQLGTPGGEGGPALVFGTMTDKFQENDINNRMAKGT